MASLTVELIGQYRANRGEGPKFEKKVDVINERPPIEKREVT